MRRNGFRGEPSQHAAPLPVYPDGLHSVYLSPMTQSATIHLVHDGTFLCKPGKHVPRLESRGECSKPTCGHCLTLGGYRV